MKAIIYFCACFGGAYLLTTLLGWHPSTDALVFGALCATVLNLWLDSQFNN